jgi:hypothetical protein
MMLQFVASPRMVTLMTLEVPVIIILATLENIYSTGITYDRQNILIVQPLVIILLSHHNIVHSSLANIFVLVCSLR